jgi:ABC-2 type transport system ATP-binding protein
MILELNRVKLSIGAAPILHDVSLRLDAGAIYGLLGPNGAGKSTTLAAALGLLKPSAGTVRLFGQDPAERGETLRARVGVLPERNGFYDWMRADDYLAFYAALYGRTFTVKEAAARLESVGLTPRAGQPIGTFSHGMRQRLGLARALIASPRLVVLDEPTTGLDPRGRRDIHDILLALASCGTAVLLCTHLLDDVERLCSRVGFIVEGRTVAEGGLTELLRERTKGGQFRLRLAGPIPDEDQSCRPVRVIEHDGEWALVDLDPSHQPQDVWRELMFRGWPILEIQRAGGGLEDLYLDLTQEIQTRRRAA